MSFTHTMTRAYRDRSGNSITSTETITGDAEFNASPSIAAAATLAELTYTITRANMKSLSLYCAQALGVFAEKATALTVDAATNAASGDAVVSVSGTHGLSQNDRIRIVGITGATNLNGTFYVKTVVDTDDIKLSLTPGGSTVQGNDASYVSGGSIYLQADISLVAGQNRQWSLSQDGLAANPFPFDVAKIFVTNADPDDAVAFEVRALADQTP